MSAMARSLRAVPLFAELSDKDLRRLEGSMHEKSYAEGRQVVTQGESGLGFFVILDGTATVTVDGGGTRQLRAGDYFGEMALLDGEQRSASITAGAGLRCAGMTAWHFRPFLKDHPEIAWALMRTLARRVREAEARQGTAA